MIFLSLPSATTKYNRKTPTRFDCLQQLRFPPYSFYKFWTSSSYNSFLVFFFKFCLFSLMKPLLFSIESLLKFESDEVYLDFVFSVCEEYKRILKPNWSLVLFFSYQYSWWIGYELKRRGLFSFRVPCTTGSQLHVNCHTKESYT